MAKRDKVWVLMVRIDHKRFEYEQQEDAVIGVFWSAKHAKHVMRQLLGLTWDEKDGWDKKRGQWTWDSPAPGINYALAYKITIGKRDKREAKLMFASMAHSVRKSEQKSTIGSYSWRDFLDGTSSPS